MTMPSQIQHAFILLSRKWSGLSLKGKLSVVIIILILFTWTCRNGGGGKYPEMVWIDGGTFKMGGYEAINEPIHSVNLPGFWISKYEVTNREWKHFLKDSKYDGVPDSNRQYMANFWGDDQSQPSMRDDFPIVNVSWLNAMKYCDWLSKKTGQHYTLPTEAQWEYASRGGEMGRWFFETDKSDLIEYAWFDQNADRTTHPVGKRKPNKYGLYDMYGNVWEYCRDIYTSYHFVPTDGSANLKPPRDFYIAYVKRGGSCDSGYELCNSTIRGSQRDSDTALNVGFRIVRVATWKN